MENPFTHSPKEFPTECVKTLLKILSEEGVAGLWKNAGIVAGCVGMLVAWLFSNKSDVLVVGCCDGCDCHISEEDEANLVALAETLGIDPPRPEIGGGLIGQAIVAAIIQAIVNAAKDSEFWEKLKEQIQDWVNG